MMLTTATLALIYSYVRVAQGDERWWSGVWVAAALGVMVKSAAGLIGLIAVCLVIALNREIVKAVRSPYCRSGFWIALSIVAPWHLYMYSVHGDPFLDMYLGKQIRWVFT